jgi:hypothetical protein
VNRHDTAPIIRDLGKALELLRHPFAYLHIHKSQREDEFWIADRKVSPRVGRELMNHKDMRPGKDGLFGVPQTYRLKP